MSWSERHIWIAFPAYLIFFFLVVSVLTSYLGGWSALAREYRATSEFRGERLTLQSVRMRWLTRYNHTVTLGCNATGLYLAMSWLFRFHHPPLFIPWNVITRSPTESFGLEMTRLHLGREPRVPLYLNSRTAEGLERLAGRHWPAETIE